MKKSVKIAISLVLVCGFIAIASNQLMSPTTSFPPYEKDPDDPGNSTGPGLGSIPTEDIDFKFVMDDTLNSDLNFQF